MANFAPYDELSVEYEIIWSLWFSLYTPHSVTAWRHPENRKCT